MKQDKSIELAHYLHHLQEMVEIAENPKLLLEEMQILGKKAFDLQEKMEQLINELETEVTEVSAVQTLYETREKMWDIMNQLAASELKIKEKTLTKSDKKCCQKEAHHGGCCCHKVEDKCCHKENHHKACECHKTKGKGCQGKEKKCPKK